jgi:glyoxylase-like metal-dependent hydrolase (beta-lactamase superfamily II)
MDQPTQMPSRRVGPDTDMISAYTPLPGLGLLPVNAYVVQAREPVLVDTGMTVLREGFMAALRKLIDPQALRWIWITHADADHIGNLRAVLDEAPHARIATNYLGVGKLGLQLFPPERTYMLNPGQALDVGDRRLRAQRPPVYDAPETMVAFDERTGHLFSSDCFGAVMQEPAEVAAGIPQDLLHEGLSLWSRVDAPWLAQIRREQFDTAARPLRELRPRLILGSHLPPAANLDERLYAGIAAALSAPPFVGPDQAALEQAAPVMTQADLAVA